MSLDCWKLQQELFIILSQFMVKAIKDLNKKKLIYKKNQTIRK